MKKTRILVSMLLLATIAVSALATLVQAGYYDNGVFVMSNYRKSGGRIVAHDQNPLQPIKYYAALWVDQATNVGALSLVAFKYVDNMLALAQPVVPSSLWLKGSGYGLSNVRNSSFYLAYQRSYNTITVVKITFQYASNYGLSYFAISNNVTFTTPNVIYDTGLDVVWTADDKVWVGAILQTNILNAAVFQIYLGAVAKTTVMPLDFDQLWNVQLGYIQNNAYVWTYGYQLVNATVYKQGRLYNANTGSLITSSSADILPSLSTVISMSDNTIKAIYYDPVTGKVEQLSYDGSTSSKATIFTFGTVYDLSAFTMPNNYYGFFFVTQLDLCVTYYSSGAYTSWSGWTPIQRLWTAYIPALGYSITGVFADSSTSVSLSVPGRPTVWTRWAFTGAPTASGYMIQSMDLYELWGMEYTTTFVPITTNTNYQTIISYTTQYTSSTTTSTTNTQSMSALQTPTFLSSLIILSMFIIMPSGMLGYLMGLTGFALGGMIGASMAFVFGKLPLWLLLVIILIETIVLFMGREKEG